MTCAISLLETADVHIPRVTPLPHLMTTLPVWLKVCSLEVCAPHKQNIMVKKTACVLLVSAGHGFCDSVVFFFEYYNLYWVFQ